MVDQSITHGSQRGSDELSLTSVPAQEYYAPTLEEYTNAGCDGETIEECRSQMDARVIDKVKRIPLDVVFCIGRPAVDTLCRALRGDPKVEMLAVPHHCESGESLKAHIVEALEATVRGWEDKDGLGILNTMMKALGEAFDAGGWPRLKAIRAANNILWEPLRSFQPNPGGWFYKAEVHQAFETYLSPKLGELMSCGDGDDYSLTEVAEALISSAELDCASGLVERRGLETTSKVKTLRAAFKRTTSDAQWEASKGVLEKRLNEFSPLVF